MPCNESTSSPEIPAMQNLSAARQAARRLVTSTCTLTILLVSARAQTSSDACASATAIVPNAHFVNGSTVGATPDGASSCDPTGSALDR